MGNMIRHILTDGFGGSKKQKEVVCQVATEENISLEKLECLLLYHKYVTGKFLDYSPNDLRELVHANHYWSFWEEPGEEYLDLLDEDFDCFDSLYD